jgi:uncharacterized protein (DUF1800 family)
MLPSEPDRIRRALNRLTFGARDADVTNVNITGLAAWLAEQTSAPPGDDPAVGNHIAQQLMAIEYAAPSVTDTRGMWAALKENRPLYYLFTDTEMLWSVAVEAGSTYAPAERTRIRQELIAATYIRNTHSRYQLREFMTDFWINHFNIGKVENEMATAMLPMFDERAIRPHVFGNFRQMLEATATSSAMLIYLDNWVSTAATPNENYAREIMELHTLGAGAYFGKDPTSTSYSIGTDGIANGYTDQDVIQASRALSGWTLKNGQRNAGRLVSSTGEFFYNPGQHNTTVTKVLNVDVGSLKGDMEQGRRFLDLIAYHPKTGPHIVGKLMRRIFGDTPPAAPTARAVAAWNANLSAPDQLKKVIEAIVTGGDEILTTPATKVRRPYERLIALARTTDTIINAHAALTTLLDSLNDGPWAWQGPNGRPDYDDYWLASGAVLTSWNLLLALPGAAYASVSLTTQTPENLLQSAMGVVDHWVGRMVGHSLAPSRMTALYNDQGGTAGVPAARRSSTNATTIATRTETALRRLVGMIAGTVEFTYR